MRWFLYHRTVAQQQKAIAELISYHTEYVCVDLIWNLIWIKYLCFHDGIYYIWSIPICLIFHDSFHWFFEGWLREILLFQLPLLWFIALADDFIPRHFTQFDHKMEMHFSDAIRISEKFLSAITLTSFKSIIHIGWQ